MITRKQKDGKILDIDHSRQVIKSISGWMIGHEDSKMEKSSVDAVLGNILKRLSLAEEGLRLNGCQTCNRCGVWGRIDELPFFDGKQVCTDCLDHLVTDEPERLGSVSALAGFVVSNGLHSRYPGQVQHWAEYLWDDDNPKETDLIGMIEERMRRKGAREYHFHGDR